MPASERIYAALAKSLFDGVVITSDPSSERAVNILAELRKASNRKPVTVSILTNTSIGKYLTKTTKVCRRHKHKRTASPNGDDSDGWDEALKTAEALLLDFKEAVEVEKAKTYTSTPQKKIAKTGAASKRRTNDANSAIAAASSKVSCSAASRKKAAKIGWEKRRKRNGKKPINGVTDSEAKQTSALKATAPKTNNANNADSGESIKSGEAKQTRVSVVRKKSSRMNGKNVDSNGPGEAKQSPAPKQKTSEGDATLRMTLTKNVANNAIVNGEAKQSSPSKQKTLEEDTTSKMVIESDESTEQPDKGVQTCVDTPIRSRSPPKRVSTPRSLFKVCQRVYAKDDATGLLYPAYIRKVMWGPKSNSTSMGFCSALVNGESTGGNADQNRAGAEEDEDEDDRRLDAKRNCYHYYVHYMGWKVKWDRWVEEAYLYEDSTSTVALAKLFTKEYNKVKPKKRGQKMSAVQVGKWMERIVALEAEHMRLEKGGKEENGECDNMRKEEDVKMSENNHAADKMEDSNETPEKKSSDDSATAKESAETKSIKRRANPNNKIKMETLQRQAQLRESSLQTKRKRSVAERLTLPFNLKTVLVQEWEVITQCNMVHNLPSQVSVREALNRYLENKLAPLREKEEEECSNGGKMAVAEEGSGKMQKDEALPKNTKTEHLVLGKEWIDMVENVALFFDQCLPIHLLFAEERSQYKSLRRQILAQNRNSAVSAAPTTTDDGAKSASQGKKSVEIIVDSINEKKPCSTQSATTDVSGSIVTASESSVSSSNNLKSPPLNLLPGRMSEIYGCEHLLRLFVRLPAVVAASPIISEMQSRRIFSKLGDLVRYLQKHQSQLFCSSFRRPLVGENRGGVKKVGEK